MLRIYAVIMLALLSISQNTFSQNLTNEDSLNTGLIKREKATVISGYGEIKIGYDARLETAKATIPRAVLFVGHRFNESIALFSEIELEDTKVEGGEEGGELSLEQFYLKFNINRDHYITAGLFLPRIGIINENHLPNTFHGTDRPYVERFVIPSTWREIGICINGIIPQVNGLNYSFALVNGLNAEGFTNGTGIRGGRYEGKNASYTNLALTGSLLYNIKNYKFQVSGYYGGAAGLSDRDADSLLLDNSIFGTAVGLVEASAKYDGKLFSFTALASYITIPDAYEINRAYANNTPEAVTGGYVEGAINLLKLCKPDSKRSFTFFTRFEMMNLDQKIASNGIKNEANEKTYWITGLEFKPTHGVVIKADYVLRSTGEQNPDLILNPYPQAPPYYTTNGFFNLGLGYSF
jgi:hypothetical protein